MALDGPRARPPQGREALREGGRFAAFWNLYRLDADVTGEVFV